MKVGEGSLGSRVASMSLARREASFFKHLSTAAAAASSWKRSMIVQAVKSGISQQRNDACLTPDGLLITVETLEGRRSPLKSLDAEKLATSARIKTIFNTH